MKRAAGRKPAEASERPPAVRRSWKLEDAKARFSEVVRLALTEGPQRVTRRGRDAVIVSAEIRPEADDWVDQLRGADAAYPDLDSILEKRDRRDRPGLFEPPPKRVRR